MSAARRLPAYASDLADARRRGFTLRNKLVGVGLGWHRPGYGYGVCVPNDTDPAVLDWSWCRGLHVMIERHGEPADRVRAAVRAIRAARPDRLLVLDITVDETRGSKIINIINPDEYGRASQAA